MQLDPQYLTYLWEGLILDTQKVISNLLTWNF